MLKRMTSKFNQRKLCRLLITVMWVMTAGVFSNVIYAQNAEVQGFSLRSAQDFAIEHSYDIRRSQMDILAAKKKVRETVSSGFPQLSSKIDYMNNLELATVLIQISSRANLKKRSRSSLVQGTMLALALP